MRLVAKVLCVLVCTGVTGKGLADNKFSLGLGVTASEQSLGQGWRALPAPSFSIEYEGYRLATRGPGLAADLVPSRALTLGPLVRYSGGRESRELPGSYRQQPDIPASAEVGLSIGSGVPWQVIGVPLPGVFTLSADLVTTFPGGHETGVFAPSVGWVSSVTPQLTLIGALGSQWGTEAHMGTFFGVQATPDTGVSAYQPAAGLKDLSLSLIASYQHTQRWSTIWLASVSQYQGDAARSPLVRDTGALNRVFLVWGVSYNGVFD
ncbi:MipA/OmpV family protein [Saccharospirillum impatiens]|uniref:MipA/OmpV family protein n=1 Tax=Saccharospirillum impatiens TaxID=169438 RepID=UPI000404229B|nr:MipA/OmpV family protein [Saccharospirillum impatiens]